jgi:hypothetical protein
MPVPNRSWPLGRASLTYTLTEYYLHQVASAAATASAMMAKYSEVGLSNDSVRGTLLIVVEANVWCSDTAGGVIMTQVNTTPGLSMKQPGFSLDPLIAQQEGYVGVTHTANQTGGNIVWRMCGAGIPDHWGDDYPICILPPGWSLAAVSDNQNVIVSAAYRWIALTNQPEA